MTNFELDPRLALYDVADATFKRIINELSLQRAGLNYLSFINGPDIPDFSDHESSFAATAGRIKALTEISEASYSIEVSLVNNGKPYARDKDLLGPQKVEIEATGRQVKFQPHLVVVSQDGPPALMHMEYFASVYNTVNDVPPLLSAEYAEILGASRATALINALGKLSAAQINDDWL